MSLRGARRQRSNLIIQGILANEITSGLRSPRNDERVFCTYEKNIEK